MSSTNCNNSVDGSYGSIVCFEQFSFPGFDIATVSIFCLGNSSGEGLSGRNHGHASQNAQWSNIQTIDGLEASETYEVA